MWVGIRVLGLCVCLLSVAWGGMLGGCGPGCEQLKANYALSGCLGEDQCTSLQTDCQIRIDCKSALQYCSGFMVGREISMQCAALDGKSFQAIVGVQETQLHITFVKDNKTCQAAWK